LSLILSAAMLLRWHGQRKGFENFVEASAAIEAAAAAALAAHEGTRDIGGTLGTREAGAALARRIADA
jgi:3-isopropylmalate dehydrogenase